MDDAATPTWHHIATGDRGSIPVSVLKDHGAELQVCYHLQVGGGLRQLFWVKRADFVPIAQVAP